jgi:DNA repair protein RAD50
MLIKGIRSFSPNNDNVIEFYKPLTLIVGHNGAGKTVRSRAAASARARPNHPAPRPLHVFIPPDAPGPAPAAPPLDSPPRRPAARPPQTIIECLKMACTGELPPNTRNGQSFIHDPKVAGETEVKAQIKLRFEAQTGQSFIVVRSFQLTQKKAALQFKALDNILQTKDPATGQTVALPYRCADINAVVPAYMGVTKAVLENVIFVHQEDSNWPLAETQVLKKKFDDIFAATKYTKALEELRKLKTRQAQDAREMRLRLETLSTHRNQAARLRGDAAAGAARAAALEAEIGALTARAAALAAARAQIDAKLGSFADVSETLMALRARHDMLASKNAESLVRLEAAYGADSAELRMAAAELEALLANMAPFADDSSAQLARLEREESTARLRAEAVRDQREREGKAHGRLAAEADAHGRNVAERDAFLRRVCAEAGAPAPVGDDPSRPLDPAAAAAFKAAFRARLDAARAALDAARGGHQREDDDRAAALDAAAAEMSAATEGARMKQDQFRANQARIAELTAQLGGAAGGSREALDAARAREAALESRLAASEAELASSSAEEAGRQAAEGLAQLAPRAEALRAERAALAADAEEATRMNYKAQELADAEARQAGLLAQHRASLGMILDLPHTEVPPPGEALLAAAQKAAAARRGEAAQRAAAAAELRARASAAAGSLSAASAQLERAASELDGLAARLAAAPEAAGGTAVASHLAELEGRRREKQAEISSSDALLRIFNAQIRMAQTTGGCATCKRKFESPAAAEQFVASTRADIEAMPGRLGAIQSEVAQLEARLKELKVLEPVAMR